MTGFITDTYDFKLFLISASSKMIYSKRKIIIGIFGVIALFITGILVYNYFCKSCEHTQLVNSWFAKQHLGNF